LSASTASRHRRPPLLVSTGCGFPEGRVGNCREELQAERGGYVFLAPPMAKRSREQFFRRILARSHFGHAFGRAPRFMHGAEQVEALPNAPSIYQDILAKRLTSVGTKIQQVRNTRCIFYPYIGLQTLQDMHA
jgi:hypothetical protein